MSFFGLWRRVWVLPVLSACGGAPIQPEAAPTPEPAARRRVSRADDCAQIPGEPAPEPLERTYTGVAAGARCQREVYTIMGGVTHFLGVPCGYCHALPDYRKMTHEKQVANWMASELIPRLRKNGAGAPPWCNDCHVAEGKGRAKILGEPRSEAFAIEWMTLHFTRDFQSADGRALHCANCHGGELGSPAFRSRVVLNGNSSAK